MSVDEFINDLEEFNFSSAGSRFWDFLRSNAWPGLKSLLKKASGSEQSILKNLIPIAVKDVVAGGFSTDSFVTAGKDVLQQLIAQNITTFNMQYVMALINAEVAPLAPPVVPAVSTAQPAVS